jgi:Fe-S cluster assembly iron-binding protein IscA
MLTITEDAATLVRSLTKDADGSRQAGLRIIVDPVHHSLSMGIADSPASADSVVVGYGARLFLSPLAAARLNSRTLRAEVSRARSVFFLDA